MYGFQLKRQEWDNVRKTLERVILSESDTNKMRYINENRQSYRSILNRTIIILNNFSKSNTLAIKSKIQTKLGILFNLN